MQKNSQNRGMSKSVLFERILSFYKQPVRHGCTAVKWRENDMKQKYQSPELHTVGISTKRSMSELAAMSDEELQKELEAAGYFKNKVCYKAADNLVARNIAGEIVLVPVGEQTKRLIGFATFTETGQFLWKVLSQKKCTKADLFFELAREYNRPQEEVQSDVDVYLEKMLKNGFVVQCS